MPHLLSRPLRAIAALLLGAAVLLGLLNSSVTASSAAPTGSAATSSRATTAASATAAFTIGTHNVHNGDATFTEFAGVIGWQEVYDAPDWAKLNRSLPGYSTYFAKPNPAKADAISWRSSRFTLVDQGYRRTHKGQAHVTPARYVVWVVLRDNKTNKTFAVVNTHFISGAWSGHPERQARWKTHATVLKAVVTELRQRGLPVLVTGDFNRHKTVSLDQTSYVKVTGTSAVPYDQLYASVGFSHGRSTKLGKSGSDHNAYRVKVTL